ncbi:hypothetical protein D3C85_1342810 [compost metagenome]
MIVPLLGFLMLQIRSKSVVFPAPLLPSTPTASPFFNCSVMFCNRGLLLYEKSRFLMVRICILIAAPYGVDSE